MYNIIDIYMVSAPDIPGDKKRVQPPGCSSYFDQAEHYIDLYQSVSFPWRPSVRQNLPTFLASINIVFPPSFTVLATTWTEDQYYG